MIGNNRSMNWLDNVKWDAQGLIPVIAQEVGSNDVLMFAWMNREALAQTATLGRAVYYSRSRSRLWPKGEESGNVQTVHEIRIDCDKDVVLLKVTQPWHTHAAADGKLAGQSIACHTGRHSCFFSLLVDGEWQIVDPVLKDPEDIYN
jgi:phosphoribosyl-AMP cyclohydrolase